MRRYSGLWAAGFLLSLLLHAAIVLFAITTPLEPPEGDDQAAPTAAPVQPEVLPHALLANLADASRSAPDAALGEWLNGDIWSDAEVVHPFQPQALEMN